MSTTITTSIAYPTASPHLGYALELVQADFLAREANLRAEETFFLTGVDQHGQKIQRAANLAGLAPLEFVTPLSDAFEELCNALHVRYDRFIRTTDRDHIATAQALWQACNKKGDIYKQQYQAWYDIKEETFLGTKEEFPNPSIFETSIEFIQLIDEENYFFRQSRYKEQIVQLLESNTLKIVPESRARELLNFVKEKGLPDISISRSRTSVSWGVPVPNDPTQVMYVWFDALTNYLTATSHLENGGIVPDAHWPASVHCVGKDIQRFHALLWPAMLLSAEIMLPETILVHGFLSVDGKKMSKSLGIGLDPLPLINKYGSDALRWLLLKEIPTTGDADINESRLSTSYSADLANTLGNLVSRLYTMVQKYSVGKAPAFAPDPYDIAADWKAYGAAVERYDFKGAMEVGFHRLEMANRMIEERKPWILAKDPANDAELQSLLYQLLEGLRHSLMMLEPALPTTAKKMAWLLDSKSQQWGGVGESTVLPKENILLFPRLS